MRFSLNTYQPYMRDKCTRIDVYPNNNVASNLVVEYRSIGYTDISVHRLISNSIKTIPLPDQLIKAMSDFASEHPEGVVYVGLDAYLALLQQWQQRDFYNGLRSLLDADKLNVRFLISEMSFHQSAFDNPRYIDGMGIVYLEGKRELTEALSVLLMPYRWVKNNVEAESISGCLAAMGDYIPVGNRVIAMDIGEMPSEDYGCLTVLRDPNEALKRLYNIDMTFDIEDADLLLTECAQNSMKPEAFLTERFGGAKYLNCEKAPAQLINLKEDRLWECYAWLLRMKIDRDSYLYRVLSTSYDATHFSQSYIVDTAISLLGDQNAMSYAREREAALRDRNSFEPLIAGFVAATQSDDRVIPFLNCGTDSELKGLILHASRLELTYGLPKQYNIETAAVLRYYLSPNYDYGNIALTEYFHKLRCFRMSNTVDQVFVEEAYNALIPKEIKQRDAIIGSYDDGETALLVVDGMGAEYYPLLLNMADENAIEVEEKRIVSAVLPTSTGFNKIKWPEERRIQEVKRVDSITHNGYSHYEKCGYEENLAEVFNVFKKQVLPRIVSGLRQYKRVVVTADHGASYIAVTAHKNGMDKTLPWPWGTPDDWRYSGMSQNIDAPEGMVAVYSATEQKTYYVVKGYNRLPKEGGKSYGLHGGATLEEILVPFVVFKKDSAPESQTITPEQMVENDLFDML